MFSKNRELSILRQREDKDTFREVIREKGHFGRFKQHFLFPFLFSELLQKSICTYPCHKPREMTNDHVTLTSNIDAALKTYCTWKNLSVNILYLKTVFKDIK